MDTPGIEMAGAPARVPGTQQGGHHGAWHSYAAGLVAAGLLTLLSFGVAAGGFLTLSTALTALTILAVAQMGVHLVFFLHISSAPDHATNVLALAFAILIVLLVCIGSVWIMGHLDANMMPAGMGRLMDMHQQR